MNSSLTTRLYFPSSLSCWLSFSSFLGVGAGFGFIVFIICRMLSSHFLSWPPTLPILFSEATFGLPDYFGVSLFFFIEFAVFLAFEIFCPLDLFFFSLFSSFEVVFSILLDNEDPWLLKVPPIWTFSALSLFLACAISSNGLWGLLVPLTFVSGEIDYLSVISVFVNSSWPVISTSWLLYLKLFASGLF